MSDVIQVDVPGKEAIRVDVSKMDPVLIERALEKCGLRTAGTLDARVKRLDAHFQARFKYDELGTCDRCELDSPLEGYEACPFCGTSEDAAPEQPPAKAKLHEPKSGEKPLVNVKEAKAKRRSQVKAEEKPMSEMVLANGASNGIAKGGGHVTGFEPVTNVVEGIAQVRRFRDLSQLALYDFAQSVAHLYSFEVTTPDGEVVPLYQTRVDASGKPYKAWSKFVEAELDIKPEFAYRLADLVAKFKRPQIEKLGTKLIEYLRVPEDKRDEAVEEAIEKGYSQKEMREVARGLAADQPRRIGAGKKQMPEGTGKEVKKAAKKAKPIHNLEEAVRVVKESGKVTAAMVLGKVKIALVAKGQVGKDGETLVRAKRVKDVPVGEELLANGVVQRFRIVETEHGLELEVERFRPDK